MTSAMTGTRLRMTLLMYDHDDDDDEEDAGDGWRWLPRGLGAVARPPGRARIPLCCLAAWSRDLLRPKAWNGGGLIPGGRISRRGGGGFRPHPREPAAPRPSSPAGGRAAPGRAQESRPRGRGPIATRDVSEDVASSPAAETWHHRQGTRSGQDPGHGPGPALNTRRGFRVRASRKLVGAEAVTVSTLKQGN